MNQVMLKKKIMHLQAEINLLKVSMSKKIDYEIDEINWKKVEPTAKKIRKQLYKKIYG